MRVPIVKLSKRLTKHNCRARIQWFFEGTGLPVFMQISKGSPGTPGIPQVLSES